MVLGGQMAALGVLLAVFAVRLARRNAMNSRELVLLGLAGALSVALMSAVNFALGSTFRWLLVLPVLTWAIGVALATLATAAGRAEAKERLHGR